MRRALLVVGLILASAGIAHAQETDEAGPAVEPIGHEDTALELLEAMRMGEVMEAQIEIRVDAMSRQAPMLAQYDDVVLDFFNKYLSWDQVRDDYVRLYAESYSEDELRELIAFYQTPLGEKMVDLIPTFQQRETEITEERMQEHMPELQQNLQEAMQSNRQ